jgi:hypothetical protein
MSIEAVGLAQTEQISSELPPRIFNHSAAEFAEKFNRIPFAVSHNLGEHPLFELPRLVELAKTLWAGGGGRVAIIGADAPVEKRWDEIPNKARSFIEAIREIQQSGSWLMLKSSQEDPEYRSCIDLCVSELSELTGVDLKKEITWIDGYVFIASPGAITPHHMDHESNFLLQIHGEKNLNVTDPNDRSVLFEEEIENYYIGDISAARFKPVSQEKAYVFPMVPGTGAHIPSKGPHWVRNGKEYSVSFSINFCMRETDIKSRIYQCNHYLRKLDFNPTPPDRSKVKDRLKILALSSPGRGKAANKFELLRHGVKRLESASRIVQKVLRRSTNSHHGTVEPEAKS